MRPAGPPTLRDYLTRCLEAIFQRYKAGVRRRIVCLPTGTGKTVVLARFPTFLRMKKRMLVLAHRARPASLALVDTLARWRHHPATEKQLARIRGAGLVVPPTTTRGQASHLLAMLFAKVK